MSELLKYSVAQEGTPVLPARPTSYKYDSMLLGGVMWMTCSTEGASTPIPRAEVANNTLIRESVFLISVIMAFFIPVVCGAWN